MVDAKEDATMTEKPVRDSVQLGCGTLIIIALIVSFFSGGRDAKQLRGQLNGMNQKIDRLEKKLDALSEKLSAQPSPTPKPSESP